jgi:hypothetical protein
MNGPRRLARFLMFEMLYFCRKGQKGPKRAKKGQKGPKRAKKGQKGPKGPKRPSNVDQSLAMGHSFFHACIN